MVIASGSENNVSLRHSLQTSGRGTLCMYRYTCERHFFFGHISSCSHLIRNVRGGGHNSTVGVTLSEVWARSVRCVARGKPFYFFWPWARIRQTPGFPQHPRGWCFCIPRGLGLRIPLMQTQKCVHNMRAYQTQR